MYDCAMIIKSYLINITQTQKCVSCLKFRLLDCILILLKSLTDTTNVFSQVMCAMGKLQPNQIWQPEPENDVREVLMHQITSWPLIKKMNNQWRNTLKSLVMNPKHFLP